MGEYAASMEMSGASISLAYLEGVQNQGKAGIGDKTFFRRFIIGCSVFEC